MSNHKLEFAITVKNSDGTEFYYEAHRIYPDDSMLTWFTDELDGFARSMHRAAGNDEDGANLSAIATSSIDGVARPDVGVSGVSYHELMRLEHEWADIGARLLKIGDDRAKTKK